MAARFSFRAEEDELQDEAGFWQYDSTWEEEEDGEGGEPEGAEAAAGEEPKDAGEQPVSSWAWSSQQAQGSARRNWSAARDLQRYRHHYPGLIESATEEEEEMWNLSFYKNEIRFLPYGLHIETLLESWWDNFEVLEENHSYIQWLFPLRERGMNWRAKPLTQQEIQAFKKSQEVMQRFVRAYQLMLRFYGILLVSEETGELKRAENWAERFQNLNWSSHNNLRITRILKCLGEMGYEHYQVHLVKFFLTETLVKETLPNVKKSALDYFLFTIRNREKRRELVHYAWQHFKPRSGFVWGPHDKLVKYRPPSAKSQLPQKAEDKQETPGEISDGSVGKDQNQSLEEEEKAGDAAELQPEVDAEGEREKISECALKGGDGEEEKEASLSHQEEKDVNSEAEEVQGPAESDCTKESKKRKLDANMADSKKTGALRSPTEIENISRNLGECAIDAQVPSPVPLSEAEEEQKTLEEDSASPKDSAVPEITDAAVKRRKVDERTTRSKPFNLAINLNVGTSASSAQAKPSPAQTEAEEGNSSEKNPTGEMNEKGSGDAGDGAVGSLVASRLSETDCASPVSDGLELSGDQVTARDEQHHCNSMLLGGQSEEDGVEQQEKEENASEKGQAEVMGRKEVPESPEQSMASTCPEEDSAEAATQKPESSQHSAEPNEEQVAAE